VRCPVCRTALVVVEREGIELDWCLTCRGLWFDQGELELLAETSGRAIDSGSLSRSAAQGSAKRRCPRELKRRYDLIPNLVETVKGYASHERETLEAVIQARQQAINITDNVIDKAKAENMLSQTLRSLFAVSENYPDLKANQNFLALQEELSSTENKISFARQFYNDSALRYNNKTEMFPSNIVAGMFNFERADFFELEAPEQREAPQVSFQ